MELERKKAKKIAEQKKAVDARLDQEMKRNTELQKEMYRWYFKPTCLSLQYWETQLCLRVYITIVPVGDTMDCGTKGSYFY